LSGGVERKRGAIQAGKSSPRRPAAAQIRRATPA